jgi:hypothetical protein
VITTGDHPVAAVLAATHVAVVGLAGVAQVYPHMGTTEPSGSVIVVGPALRATCCAANETLAPRRRTDIARIAVFKVFR